MKNRRIKMMEEMDKMAEQRYAKFQMVRKSAPISAHGCKLAREAFNRKRR